jgi:hypothetical protein
MSSAETSSKAPDPTSKAERMRPAAAVHERTRPRAIGLGIDGENATRLKAVFPTIDVVTNLSSVEQLDYDVLITDRGVSRGAGNHLFVLARDTLGAGQRSISLGDARLTATGPSADAEFGPQSITREFVRPELPAPIASLVIDVLEPGVRDRQPQRILHFTTYTYGPTSISWNRVAFRPFLVGNDGTAIAGSFVRPSGAHCWALPDFVVDLLPWAVAAVREWRLIEPERFPGEPDWLRAARWATPDEAGLASVRLELEAELDRLQAEYGARLQALSRDLARLQTEGDKSHRILLTAQSDELVSAVAAALHVIGFQVELVDAGGRQNKVEDIRIRDQSDRAWIALAEVKGYARGGAKSNDLIHIGKFETLFTAEQGRAPSAAWYVVNHNLTEDPALRRPALEGAEDDVRAFADGGGLVLDTRELFDLRVDVESGAIEAEEVRILLRSTRGRLEYRRHSK